MSPEPARPVPWSGRLAYAAPAFGLAVVGIPIYVYLPKFYTDVVGVPVAVVGGLLLAVRVFDGVSDPLIGALSDRTRTRLGRRRPWLLLAPWPLAASVWLLFVPPELEPGAATLWLGATLFALFLFWTAVTVPYEALGPEISFDYDERTSLLGLRDAVLLLGTLVAANSPALAGWALGPEPASERARFAAMAAVYAPLLVLLCSLCAAVIPERRALAARPASEARAGLRALAANRPFAILLVSYTVSALGSNLPATLIPFYVEYVLEDERLYLFLGVYFGVGMALLPAWIALARRVGKKAAWIASMALNTGAFLAVFGLGPGQGNAYLALVVLSGVGFGGTLAIPSSMQADVIDYDELLTGRRREGAYIGIWSIARKLAAALGVGAALALLGAAGYRPNAVQTPEVRTALRVLYCLVPSVLNLVAIALALRYPIDRMQHSAILEAISRRREGAVVVDPLRPGATAGVRT